MYKIDKGFLSIIKNAYSNLKLKLINSIISPYSMIKLIFYI